MIAYIDSIKWSEFSGDLKGFSSTEEAPELAVRGDGGLMVGGEGVLEASTMAGTDESV